MTFITLRRFIINLFLLLIVLSFTNCEPKNDEDLVPSYLHIQKIDVTTTYEQGSASSSITDAWVYIDDKFIGSFELPATVPILAEGKQNIVVRPGIKLNGISNTRTAYPYYTSIERELTLVKDSVINLSGSVTYQPTTNFAWKENFDESGISLDTTSKSDVNIVKTNESGLVYPENNNAYSGMITLTSDSSVFEVVSSSGYAFPENGKPVFLELNYRINHEMVVGVYYKDGGVKYQRPLIILNPTDEWKKVYVNLTVPKYDTPSAYDFEIFFGSQKKAGTADALFLIDNLKLVF